MGRSSLQKRSLGITTRRRERHRSATSYHNEVTSKTHGGKGYCTLEHKWKVCDWPKCGEKKKEKCLSLFGYKPETEKEN